MSHGFAPQQRNGACRNAISIAVGTKMLRRSALQALRSR